VIRDTSLLLGGSVAASFLLWYLHGQWQPAWALVCGLFAAFVVRRIVAPSYEAFPDFLKRPLDATVVLLGAIIAAWATLAWPQYGGFPYALSVWREAVALLAVGIFIGLGLASLIYTYGRLEKEIAQRERLEDDLRLAKGIQESLLRSEFPELPWVEAHAMNIPSRSVGGDYYEVFEAAPGSLGFAVGDVSGKGVPAALLMSTLQSSFLGVCDSERDLAEVCRRVNQFLVKRTSPERYATFFVGKVDQSGCLDYVNAGHNPPLLRRGDDFLRLSGGGMPLGLFADATYEQQRLSLLPEDLILTYTDGVTESMNRTEEEFGEERLRGIVARTAGGGARGVLDAVLEAIENHTHGEEQFDDLTLLVLRWTHPKEDHGE
jgi:hypothetical protein